MGATQQGARSATGTVVVEYTNETIDALVAQRIAARKARDFKESDRIRDLLKAQGVQLEDSGADTKWRRG